MNSYETFATVEDQGRVQVVGVPFAAGTEVEVLISPKPRSGGAVASADDESVAASRQRMQELFHTVKGFRNMPRISREELHERGSLR